MTTTFTPQTTPPLKQFRDTPYYVSHEGEIYRWFQAVRKVPERFKKLNPSPGTHGYLRLNMSIKGVTKSVEVHTVVAEVFHGPRPNEMAQVNHKDGVKTNNHPDNLKWVTPGENVRHAFDTGLAVGKPLKLTVKQVISIRRSRLSHARIAAKFGIHRQTAIKIRRGDTWKHVKIWKKV